MSKEKKPLGIGIIGCGKITETRHAPEYAANAAARIIGYFDYVKERAEALDSIVRERDYSERTEKLKVLVGHTPLQVFFGALLGIAVSVAYILLSV